MQLSLLVAHHLHLELLPAEHGFFDQHFAGWRGIDAAFDDVDEFRLVVSDAAAGAAQREGWPDDCGQADFLERRESLDQSFDLSRSRCFEADLAHRFAEQLAILRLVDGIGGGADHLHAEYVQGRPSC